MCTLHLLVPPQTAAHTLTMHQASPAAHCAEAALTAWATQRLSAAGVGLRAASELMPSATTPHPLTRPTNSKCTAKLSESRHGHAAACHPCSQPLSEWLQLLFKGPVRCCLRWIPNTRRTLLCYA